MLRVKVIETVIREIDLAYVDDQGEAIEVIAAMYADGSQPPMNIGKPVGYAYEIKSVKPAPYDQPVICAQCTGCGLVPFPMAIGGRVYFCRCAMCEGSGKVALRTKDDQADG